MNLLILGSGGREHALAWKLSQSDKIENLYIAPGNAGTATVGTNIPVESSDFDEIKMWVVEKEIDLVVVGPEIPLVNGIVDFFYGDPILKTVPIIGPDKKAAQLEGSKDFAKQFMQRYNIPTAKYKTFTIQTLNQGYQFLDSLTPPFVLKADGLAGGKGVLIVDNPEDAKAEFKEMLTGSKFGEASQKVIIEEFLDGIELSVFVITDGKNYKILPEAKDYKRIGENDTGKNTGGMGAISPVSFANKEFMLKVQNQIIEPTLAGLQNDGLQYKGFIFFGLMNVNGSPYVIEYNCRLGDPEAEAVIPRIKSDMVDLLEGVAQENLNEKQLVIDDRYTATVVLVSAGYPEKYETGKAITGLNNLTNCILFYAGVSNDIDENIYKTSGGRVIAVTAYGNTMEEALKTSYENIAQIQFDGKTFRQDIGFDLK